MGLNFAGTEIPFEKPEWTSWKNFHSPRTFDTRLYNAFELYLMGNDPQWLFDEYVKKNKNYNKIKSKINKVENIGSPAPKHTDWESKLKNKLDLTKR